MQIVAMAIDEYADPQHRERHLHSDKLKWLWLERLLANWAAHSRRNGTPEFHVKAADWILGFKHYDVEGGYIEADSQLAELIDTIIEQDIKKLERAAIHCEYLGAAWLHDISIHTVLPIAYEAIRQALNRKGMHFES